MDEFQSEDELKPDTSDRPGRRKSRTAQHEKTGASRQYVMTGIGIVVLLLIIIGIGTAINSPGNKENSTDKPTDSNVVRTEPKTPDNIAAQGENTPRSASAEQNQSPSETDPQPVDKLAELPAAGFPLTPATLDNRSLKASINTAVPTKQAQNDASAGNQPGAKHPTAPLHQAGKEKQSLKKVVKTHAPAKSANRAQPVNTGGTGTGNYTLQLSGSTTKKPLEAWAASQRLVNYQVLETKRQGHTWFILVSGHYSSPAAAKKAIPLLPAAVRAKNPWVKSLKHLNN